MSTSPFRRWFWPSLAVFVIGVTACFTFLKAMGEDAAKDPVLIDPPANRDIFEAVPAKAVPVAPAEVPLDVTASGTAPDPPIPRMTVPTFAEELLPAPTPIGTPLNSIDPNRPPNQGIVPIPDIDGEFETITITRMVGVTLPNGEVVQRPVTEQIRRRKNQPAPAYRPTVDPFGSDEPKPSVLNDPVDMPYTYRTIRGPDPAHIPNFESPAPDPGTKKLHDLVEAYKAADTAEKRAEFAKEIDALIGQQFDEQLKRRQVEARRIEERLAKLKVTLESRAKARQTIIDRRKEVLLNGGADPYAWEDQAAVVPVAPYGAPMYGMPNTGTPFGPASPPYIPLGMSAGLPPGGAGDGTGSPNVPPLGWPLDPAPVTEEQLVGHWGTRQPMPIDRRQPAVIDAAKRGVSLLALDSDHTFSLVQCEELQNDFRLTVSGKWQLTDDPANKHGFGLTLSEMKFGPSMCLGTGLFDSEEFTGEEPLEIAVSGDSLFMRLTSKEHPEGRVQVWRPATRIPESGNAAPYAPHTPPPVPEANLPPLKRFEAQEQLGPTAGIVHSVSGRTVTVSLEIPGSVKVGDELVFSRRGAPGIGGGSAGYPGTAGSDGGGIGPRTDSGGAGYPGGGLGGPNPPQPFAQGTVLQVVDDLATVQVNASTRVVDPDSQKYIWQPVVAGVTVTGIPTTLDHDPRLLNQQGRKPVRFCPRGVTFGERMGASTRPRRRRLRR